jgi:hypothetical protein
MGQKKLRKERAATVKKSYTEFKGALSHNKNWRNYPFK